MGLIQYDSCPYTTTHNHITEVMAITEVMIEAGIEVLKLQAKGHSRLPANHQTLGRVKEGAPHELPEGARPC